MNAEPEIPCHPTTCRKHRRWGDCGRAGATASFVRGLCSTKAADDVLDSSPHSLTHRRPSLTESIISSAALSTRASSNRRYTWPSKECMLSTLTMQPACRDGMEHIPLALYTVGGVHFEIWPPITHPPPYCTCPSTLSVM